jgi:hypothetical protein
MMKLKLLVHQDLMNLIFHYIKKDYSIAEWLNKIINLLSMSQKNSKFKAELNL